MSRIVDLGLLVRDPLIFRDTKGEEYTIPGEVDLGFVMKLMAFQEKMPQIKSEIESIRKGQEMVVDILSLDKSKNITLELVQEKFNDLRYIKAVIGEMMKFIHEIAQDPNSNSPV